MPWPSLDEYFATLQNPDLCFADPRLTGGTVQPNTMGLPLIVCGQFAGVCRVDCGSGGVWAVRFFQSNRAGIRDRYQAISAHLRAHKSPIFATFEFVDDGIMVNGAWYPIVLMEWVAGESLLEHIAGLVKRRDTQGLRDLAERWVTLLQDLEALEVAHGDLQHGNIRVQSDGRLRLIDYDGMWVPALKGQQSLELGLADYQHPGRCADHFGPTLDRFSGAVVCTALLALCERPDLWRQHGSPDTLLFGARDFAQPNTSALIMEMSQSSGDSVRQAVDLLKTALIRDPLDGPAPGDLLRLLMIQPRRSSPPQTRCLRALPGEIGLMLGDHYVPVFGTTSPLPWTDKAAGRRTPLLEWRCPLHARDSKNGAWIVTPVVTVPGSEKGRELAPVIVTTANHDRSPQVRVSLDCYGKLTVSVEGHTVGRREYWPWRS